MEKIFVSDGGRNTLSDAGTLSKLAVRGRKLEEIRAYLYHGWIFSSWGMAPVDSNLKGTTGFYFERRDDSSGPGFGASQTVLRLRSGLHAAMVVT